MIEQWVREAAGGLWGDIAYYLTFAWADPFWSWALWLAMLYFIVLIVAWLFGALWPPLRWIGGVMLAIATFGLVAYAKGERDARAHDKPEPVPIPDDPPPRGERWRWPW